MKRHLKENLFDDELCVKLCVSEIRLDDETVDCNDLRDMFVEMGANVEGSYGHYDGKPATIMSVCGLSKAEVIDALSEFLDGSDCVSAEDYIINDNIDLEAEEEYPDYEDVELDPEDEEYPAYEDVDALEDEEYPDYEDVELDPEDKEYPAFEDVELDSEDKEYPAFEDVELDPEDDVLNSDLLSETDSFDEESDELYDKCVEAVQTAIKHKLIIDESDIEDNMYEIVELVVDDPDDLDDDEYFHITDLIHQAWYETQYEENDFSEYDEEDLPRFEKMKRGRRLEEKRKGCCPSKGMSLNETVKMVLNDINEKSIAKQANYKLNDEIINNDKLEAKTIKALMENRHSLHFNIRYNGKSFDKMTLKELRNLYRSVLESKKSLTNDLKNSLNESINISLKNKLNKKNQLLEFLDEEITYRMTRMKCLNILNEDSAEISDDELANLFGPAQGADGEDSNDTEGSEDADNAEGSDDADNADDTEEVELSRIEITLKDADAANDLKQACVDAGIPEDAIELENADDDITEEDEDSEGEETEGEETEGEETEGEETEEGSEEESDGTNESYEYSKYVKMLLEGEDVTDGEEETTEEGGDDTTSEESDDETSDEESEEDKQPKFILTNTDYAAKLAKVLDDVYGISKEEFEDMIGGEIVEEESDDEEGSEDGEKESSEEGDSDENKKEDKDKEGKKEKDEKDEDDDDDIDPSDLFKNL